MPFYAGLLVDVNVDPSSSLSASAVPTTRQSASRAHGKVIAVLLKGSELANPMDGAATHRGPFTSVPTMELLRPASHNQVVNPSLTEKNRWINI